MFAAVVLGIAYTICQVFQRFSTWLKQDSLCLLNLFLLDYSDCMYPSFEMLQIIYSCKLHHNYVIQKEHTLHIFTSRKKRVLFDTTYVAPMVVTM